MIRTVTFLSSTVAAADYSDPLATRLGKRWASYVEGKQDYRVIMELAMLYMGIGRAEDPTQYVDLEHGVDLPLLQPLCGLDREPQLKNDLWQKVGAVADEYYQPGIFSALIGYEWTSTTGGNNLHRNMMFRDSSAVTAKISPFSAVDSSDPADLWQFLAG